MINDGTEYKDHLDLGRNVEYFDANEDTQTIIDYSVCVLPGILLEAERKRAVAQGGPVERSNDEWRKIGNGWGKTGDILIDFIMDRLRAAYAPTGGVPRAMEDALNKIKTDMNNRYDYIMEEGEDEGHGGGDNSLSGLENLFKYKSQQFDTTINSVPQCGGPTDFFRFLFDFVVPPKKKLNRLCKKDNIRSILERPPAAGKGGQCWKAYGDQVNDDDNDYDTRLWKERPPGPPDDRRMHCYICEVKLKSKHKSYIDSFFPSRSKDRDFQCEHLFPFTEGMLFWILYRDDFTLAAAPDDYKTNLLKIQKREYAPVCRHCNVDLKTSLGILSLNPLWLNAANDEARKNIDCVILNSDNINRISGKYNLPLPGHDTTRYPHLTTTNHREIRIRAVFDPLIKAINKSIKNRGIVNRQDLLKFLIYKYLFYFDEGVMNNIEKMFIGGGGSKKLLIEKQKRNKVFSTMIKSLSTLYNNYKKKALSLQKKQDNAQREYNKATVALNDIKARPRSSQRQVEIAQQSVATKSTMLQRAQQVLQQARQAAVQFNQHLKDIFKSKFSLSANPTDQEIMSKIEEIRDNIKSGCAADYTKENPTTNTMIEELINEPPPVSGGGKIKVVQKGGNYADALECYADYEKIYQTLQEILEGMEAAGTVDYQPSLLDYIVREFSRMTFDYVKENINGTNELIDKVLANTVDTEDVAGENIEFDLDVELENLKQAIAEEERRVSVRHPEASIQEVHILKTVLSSKNYYKIQEAFVNRQDDGECDPKISVEKYSAKLDPNVEEEEEKTIEEIRSLYNLAPKYTPRVTEYYQRTEGSKQTDAPINEWRDINWVGFCLRCTKKSNSRGYNPQQDRLYSESSHGKNQEIMHEFYNNGHQVQSITPKGETMYARFCPSCKKTLSGRSNGFPTQGELNRFAAAFDTNKLRRKELEIEEAKRESERERARERERGMGITRTLTSDYPGMFAANRQHTQGNKPSKFKKGDFVTYTSGAGRGTGTIQHIYPNGKISIKSGTFFITIDPKDDKISCRSESGDELPPPCPSSKGPNFIGRRKLKRQAEEGRISEDRHTPGLKTGTTRTLLPERVQQSQHIMRQVNITRLVSTIFTRLKKRIIIPRLSQPIIKNIKNLIKWSEILCNSRGDLLPPRMIDVNSKEQYYFCSNMDLNKAADKAIEFWFINKREEEQTHILWRGGKRKTKRRRKKKKKSRRKNKRKKKTKRRRRKRKKTRRRR